MKSPFKGLIHGAITVANLEQSIEFFRDTLGMDVDIPKTRLDDPGTAAAIGVEGAVIDVAFLNVGSSIIELTQFENPAPEPELDDFFGTVDIYETGAALFGLATDDLEQTKADLEAKGVTFLSAINPVLELSPLYARGARKWVRMLTNEGQQIELIETV